MITRDIVEEQTAHAGVHRHRVLSLVDRLHKDKAIDFAQYAAAVQLRTLLMLETPPSEGVSSYGGNVGHSDGATKADRLGQRLTGCWITYDGKFSWVGHRRLSDAERQLDAALFAAVGCYDCAGQRRLNARDGNLLLRVVTHTEDMPTLAGIARQLTKFYKADSKHAPAYGLSFIATLLSRLAMHFGLAK